MRLDNTQCGRDEAQIVGTGIYKFVIEFVEMCQAALE
jgi:hypothetical protein